MHRFFEHIRLEIGEAFIFLDDKLMVRMAAFLRYMAHLCTRKLVHQTFVSPPSPHKANSEDGVFHILTLEFSSPLNHVYSNVLPQGPPVWEDKEEDGETSAGSMAGGSIKLTTSVNPWEVLGRGIMPELSELRMTIMMGKSAEQRIGPISR